MKEPTPQEIADNIAEGLAAMISYRDRGEYMAHFREGVEMLRNGLIGFMHLLKTMNSGL